MPVIQPALIIPPTYQIRLDSGELWRDGGVLRRVANGTIALILKDGVVSEENTTTLQQAAQKGIKKLNLIQLAKDHKVATATGIAGFILSLGVGIYLYVEKTKSDKALEETAKRVSDFRLSLTRYLKKATSGELLSEDITSLLGAVSSLEKEDSGRIVIDLSEGELRDLVNCIISYTRQLAEANSYELDATEKEANCSIALLRSHLETQKKIFESVA